jgi:hypothetical protein
MKLLLCLLGSLVEPHLLNLFSQLIEVLYCERVQILRDFLELAVDHSISASFALAALE